MSICYGAIDLAVTKHCNIFTPMNRGRVWYGLFWAVRYLCLHPEGFILVLIIAIWNETLILEDGWVNRISCGKDLIFFRNMNPNRNVVFNKSSLPSTVALHLIIGFIIICLWIKIWYYRMYIWQCNANLKTYIFMLLLYGVLLNSSKWKHWNWFFSSKIQPFITIKQFPLN